MVQNYEKLGDNTDTLPPSQTVSFSDSFELRDFRPQARSSWFIIAVGSIFLNVSLVIVLLLVQSVSQEQQRSLYAGLSFDTVKTISHLGSYGLGTRNETARAILWENLDTSNAQVAVDKSWAASKGLPATQEFTWDKKKSVYSLRAFHAQHCLRKLYRWIAISYHNGTQLDHYEHVIHCLDSILQDIHCYADDTPMKSTPPIWGEGQQRQCRDWNKLEEWAEQQHACFAYLNETQGVDSMFDRYKWCPQGSPYEARVRSALNLPNGWNAPIPKDIDSLPAYWAQF